MLLAEQDGVPVWTRTSELSAILTGTPASARNSDDEITLFKSNGLALEDVAVAHHVYTRIVGGHE